MTGDWAIERTVRLSCRHTVTLTAVPGGMTAEWKPLSRRGSLTRKEIACYRAARDALIRELAARTGLRIMVVELQP
jgi:hypothetical protein